MNIKKKSIMLSTLVCAMLFLGVGCSRDPIEIVLPEVSTHSDFNNISYSIEGKDVQLTDGISEIQIEVDSSSTLRTEVFSAVAEGDMNNDGLLDTVVLLTQHSGGSGTFFYVALAIQTEEGYRGTNAILIGDRIAPQSATIQDNLLVVNYVERNIDEDFTVSPSVGTSMYLQYIHDTLIARPEAIQVTSPYPYEEISSPLTITGEARGGWFFEASFPVLLVDWDGRIIAEGIAQAQSDWMTNEFVPFEATLAFVADTSVSDRGTLILKKDNPTGLSQYDDALEIPVLFSVEVK